MQRLRYTAHHRDNGRILQCFARQEDDQGTASLATGAADTAQFYLAVKQVQLEKGPSEGS